MRPVLFSIGDFQVYPFFTTIIVGALLASFLFVRLARRGGLSELAALDMCIIAMLASIIGTRLFHIVFEYQFHWYYLEDWRRIFYFHQGGFVSLGAYVCSVVGWLIYFRRKHLPALPYFDMVTRVVPIVEFFVRLGCLLTGCCYGKPTNFFIHLVFPPGSTAYHFHRDTPLHATQVYFMITAVVFFIGLQWVYRRRRFPGQVLAVYLMASGVVRFAIEFLRGDGDRGMYLTNIVPGGGISTGQIMMLVAIGVGVWLYRRGQRQLAHGQRA